MSGVSCVHALVINSLFLVPVYPVQGAVMKKLDEHVLKITKEIVAKFIEVGRVSPTTFDEVFKSVFKSVKEAVLAYGPEEKEES